MNKLVAYATFILAIFFLIAYWAEAVREIQTGDPYFYVGILFLLAGFVFVIYGAILIYVAYHPEANIPIPTTVD